jgi:hypothetical protein
MRTPSEWLHNLHLALIALCAYAGFLSCTNHTPVQELTAKRYAISIASSIFVGIVAINLLAGTDFPEKFKLGVAVAVGYAARPVLDELYRIPSRLWNLFEKKIQGKNDK